MLNKIGKSFLSLGKVFSKIKYVMLALVFGFLFYFLNFLISAFGNISSFYKARGFSGIIPFTYTIFINFKESILFSSFISIIILSFLTGILFSLILYKNVTRPRPQATQPGANIPKNIPVKLKIFPLDETFLLKLIL